ncbi:MAG: 1-deoxy-D-xylulose-5-phosphate synthase [Bacteroides sp.]|nr:1-deoxy-D-xylulose-5-phosphate synthase [Bacteroides sp.]
MDETTSNKYPLLSKIDSPDDLRKLAANQLSEVCDDIRRMLIESLSSNPGHFASSMGAVELTVALHYVFNTPYDRIVWDVGHQAYGHKLLTGRRDRFETNRKLGGLSGFPNPDESEYDTFTAGHASNSISAALGMAIASELNHDEPRRNVVAVIGDSAIAGGLAFEGLNNATNVRNNLLIILNDNDMSIDDPVGGLNSYLAHLTTSPGYNNLRDLIYRGLRKVHLIGDKQKGAILRFNNSLKALLSRHQNIFEGLNIRYFGPFDGNDLPTLIQVLNDIKDMRGPRILHLKTKKGKGFAPAESNPSLWHAPGKFDAETGVRQADVATNAVKPPKYQDVFGETLLELARQNPDIVGITAAMASGTSMNIMQAEMPDRVFDVGISEGHAVTFAGGLAKEGKRPFCAIYSSFLQRAYDNVIHDTAILRLPVVFCIDRAGLVGQDGVTHHGLYDMAYMRTIPGVTISSPSDEQMLRNLMFTASKWEDGPFVIRYPRGEGHNVDWKNEMQQLPVGRGRKVADGNDVALLSIGPIAYECSIAASQAEKHGVSVAQYDMIFLKPLDDEILHEVAKKNVPIVTVEDASANGGLGSAVTEWMNDHGYARRVIRLGVPDRFIAHGTVDELYKICGIDADSIASTLVDVVKSKNEQK